MRASCRGLTLIELILVMGLLAGIAALSIPKVLGSLEGQYLHDEARRIIAASRYARSEAISSGQAMKLWVRLESCEYGVAQAVDSGDSPSTGRSRTFALSEPLYFTVETPAREKSQQEELTALFQPDGSLAPSSFDRLTIAQNGHYRLSVARVADKPGYEIEDRKRDE
ncbi:MAG: GspH/FimT family pseudopilin [Candidatus Hydrogenedentes bacterium]|nr:GspH/FimT family pseudopilin [Candidatus Hydrogenedentota bacterium]